MSNLLLVVIAGGGVALMGLMIVNSAAFSSCVQRISSSAFASLFVLAIRFGFGLSFRVFCAESLKILLISTADFCALIFLFVVVFFLLSLRRIPFSCFLLHYRWLLFFYILFVVFFFLL
jgi:uncharacterized membrane protein